MSKAVSSVTDAVGLSDTGRGGDAASEAASMQAKYQTEALEYLKEKEKLPTEFREAALTGLGAEYGLTLDEEGNVISDDLSMIERAEASPFYETSVQRGEEAVLRNQAATGGLRSGTASENLAKVNQDVLQQAYNKQLSGLQGFADLPQNTNAIANQMSSIGQTYAQGITGEVQSDIAAEQQNLSELTGFASMFSDSRLKDNLSLVGKVNGHNWYRWDWNEKANELGLTGSDQGVIAQEVKEYMPEAVSYKDGYLSVNYKMLGVQ